MVNFFVVSTYPTYNDLLTTVDSDSIGNAFKNYVKFYHQRDINEMIFRDQYNHWKANVRYMHKNGKKRAEISINQISQYNAYPKSVIPIMNNYNQPTGFIGTVPVNNLNTPASNLNGIVNLMPFIPPFIKSTYS